MQDFKNAQCRLDGKRGHVAIAKYWINQKHRNRVPKKDGYTSVYAAKGKQGTIGNQLTPFYLSVPNDMTDGCRPDMPLELVWQAAKVRVCEMDSKGCVLPAYFKRREKIYAAGVPKRRYLKYGELPACAIFGNDPTKTLAYQESRFFYCQAYERAVKETPAFKFLCEKLDQGYNILLLGPDGYPMKNQTIEEAYEDTSKPFGHERVLCALLNFAHDPEHVFPWWL